MEDGVPAPALPYLGCAPGTRRARSASSGAHRPHSLLKQQLSVDIVCHPLRSVWASCVPSLRPVVGCVPGHASRPAARPDDERLCAPGVEAAAASAVSAAALSCSSLLSAEVFCFPLPAGALCREVAGQPSERSVRWLGWQMQRLRWEAPAAMPTACGPLRAQLSGAVWSGAPLRRAWHGTANASSRYCRCFPDARCPSSSSGTTR